MVTTVINAEICAKVDKYFRERPQLKKPKSDIMGFELDSKILPFIESMLVKNKQLEKENKKLKELVEMLTKTPLPEQVFMNPDTKEIINRG